MSLTHAYAGEITKFDRTADGDLLVYGKATGPDLDLDEQVCDPAWLKSAMPDWGRWANVRAMHGPIAAGVGVETAEKGEDWYVKSLITDSESAHKVETGTYKGYSIGIKNARVVKDASAPGGRIVGGTIVEISLVDRPCNPTATVAIAKAASGSNELRPVDITKAVLLDGGQADPAATKNAPNDEGEPAVDKAAAEGDAPAPTGAAPAEGDGADGYGDTVLTPAQKTAQLRGETGNAPEPNSAPEVAPDAADKHQAPGAQPAPAASKSALLDPWMRQRAEAYVTKALAGDLNLHTLVKADTPDGAGNDEDDDLATAAQVLVLLGRLICSEAEELAAGDFREAYDISLLMDMVCSLRCFIGREEEQSAGSFAPAMEFGETVFVSLAAEPDLVKAKYTAEQLRQMLKDGKAIKNAKGQPSYPIGDKDDLGDAIKAVGRGKGDHNETRKYIIRRAKDLGASDMIPDSWNANGSNKPAAKAAQTSDTPPAQAAMSGDQITDIVTKAVAEASRANEERIKALTAEVEQFRNKAIPGGPMLIEPAKAPVDEHLTKAEEYRLKAARCSDPSVARDYRALADEEAMAAARR